MPDGPMQNQSLSESQEIHDADSDVWLVTRSQLSSPERRKNAMDVVDFTEDEGMNYICIR